jgi:glycerol-3-phosphate acyltransferase PlsX
LAASTIKLRRLRGIDRPAIATVIPTPENEFVLLDAGANVESKPIHLVHYAIMGSLYSSEVLGYSRPRVGLLCNGTEVEETVALGYRILKSRSGWWGM